MNVTNTRFTPEALISAVLRTGVMLSVALVVFGTIVSFAHHPSYFSSVEALAPLTNPGSGPRTLSQIAAGLAQFRGQAIVTLGLLVLFTTPIVRVALSVLIFWKKRDRRFAAMTALVLFLLLASFLLGKP